MQFLFLFIGKPIYSIRFIFNETFVFGKSSKLFDRTNPDWVLSLNVDMRNLVMLVVGGNYDKQSRYLRTKRIAEKQLQIKQNEVKPYSKNINKGNRSH